MIKTASFLGKLAAGYEVYSTMTEYKAGEINGARASWRISGTAAGLFTPMIYSALVGTETAGPVGTVLGIAVGVSFSVLEVGYDYFKPQVQASRWYIGNLDLTRWGKWH